MIVRACGIALCQATVYLEGRSPPQLYKGPWWPCGGWPNLRPLRNKVLLKSKAVVDFNSRQAVHVGPFARTGGCTHRDAIVLIGVGAEGKAPDFKPLENGTMGALLREPVTGPYQSNRLEQTSSRFDMRLAPPPWRSFWHRSSPDGSRQCGGFCNPCRFAWSDFQVETPTVSLFPLLSLRLPLCGLAGLHYILQKNIWEESEVARLCTSVSLVFHAVSPRPGLVKLLALSNFQARRRSLRDSRFTGHLGQFFDHCWYLCHRCLLFSYRMRALVTGISNPMTALRRFSSCF